MQDKEKAKRNTRQIIWNLDKWPKDCKLTYDQWHYITFNIYDKITETEDEKEIEAIINETEKACKSFGATMEDFNKGFKGIWDIWNIVE